MREKHAMQQPAAGKECGPREERPHIGRRHRTQESESAEDGDEIEGEIHAQHEEIALGKIDDAHHAEDEAEPDAHQAVDAAEENPRRQRLQKRLDDRVLLFEVVSCRSSVLSDLMTDH